MRLRVTVVASCLFALFTLPAAAQGPPADPDEAQVETPNAPADASSDAQIEELSRRIDLLATELELLRSGETAQVEITTARRESLGLAPSAAATYRRSTHGVSLAGYGEMLLENFSDEPRLLHAAVRQRHVQAAIDRSTPALLDLPVPDEDEADRAR